MKYEGEIINQKVNIKINLDGDIFVWNKNLKIYIRIGHYISEEFAEDELYKEIWDRGLRKTIKEVNEFCKALKESC